MASRFVRYVGLCGGDEHGCATNAVLCLTPQCFDFIIDEEREALQFIYDVLEIPELLSDDAGTRFVAEERARMAKEFPLKATGGFGANKSKRKKVKGKKRSRK